MLPTKTIEFINHLQKFQPYNDTDPTWYVIFNNGKTKWYYLIVSFYKNVYYVTDRISGNSIAMKIDGSIKVDNNYTALDKAFWDNAFLFANTYLLKGKKNWLATYLNLQKSFPYKY